MALLRGKLLPLRHYAGRIRVLARTRMECQGVVPAASAMAASAMKSDKQDAISAMAADSRAHEDQSMAPTAMRCEEPDSVSAMAAISGYVHSARNPAVQGQKDQSDVRGECAGVVPPAAAKAATATRCEKPDSVSAMAADSGYAHSAVPEVQGFRVHEDQRGDCPGVVPPASAMAATAIRCEKQDSVSAMAADPDAHFNEGFENRSKARGFQIVVAATRNLGIGRNGKLPWSLPSDMAFFKKITSEVFNVQKQNAVIMGRRTWESIPRGFRPLAGRLNVVLSRNALQVPGETLICDGLKTALDLLSKPPYDSSIEAVFVIGGGEIFREAMSSPHCNAIHLTDIQSEFECDTFMPPINTDGFRLWSASSPTKENEIYYSFFTYIRSRSDIDLKQTLPKSIIERHEEYQYLNLIKDIIETGNVKTDRTGTGTMSKFGCQMRFNLRHSFPLLTTKRVFWRGVVEELLWFISGSTNAKVLEEKAIHIWKGNGSREYLDGIGLSENEEGDLGPVYGFQWRHFGARYTNMHADYMGQGVDQLAEVIHKIKTNPDDRRIILSAWNPADLKLMALPPCHMFAQFYVANGELSCQMYQRSCDMGLGVPFNIASYALLTCIIAHVCDLSPGDFIHVLGDAHVYNNHVEPLREQLKNIPKPFPTLKIVTDNKDINSLTAKDFQLVSYESHQKMTIMKLYGMRRGVGSPWRVRLALAFKEIPYDYKVAESREMARLNPLGLLPALETDDGVIADSIAILEYLEETFPEKPLLPSDPTKRAVVRQVVHLVASTIQPLQNRSVLELVEQKLGKEERLSWAQYWITKGFSALEETLQGTSGKYCFGNEVTLADLVLIPQVSNAITHHVNMSQFPTIQKIYEELNNLPQVQSTLPID